MNAVSKDLYAGIVSSTDTRSVWSDLKERFEKINGSRIFSLHKAISLLTQCMDSVSYTTISLNLSGMSMIPL